MPSSARKIEKPGGLVWAETSHDTDSTFIPTYMCVYDVSAQAFFLSFTFHFFMHSSGGRPGTEATSMLL